MPKKPTYEELEQRVKELEKETLERKQQRKELSVVYDALNSSVSGVTITYLDGRITYVNPAFLRIFGYRDKAEVLGKNAADLFATEEVKKFSDVQAIIDQTRGDSEELEAHRKDGATFPVEVSSSNVTDHTGKIVGRMASFFDISERKRAQQELQKTNEELRNFVHIVSHDLKNPIISIKGFSSRLLKNHRKGLGEKALTYVEHINTSATRMELFVTDLLALSRIGRVVSMFRDISCAEIVDRVVSHLQDKLEGSDVEIIVRDNLPIICCDVERIYQVFENLISNAIKYTRDARSPKIDVGYEDKGGFHQFHVRDNGIGIDPKYHRKIFEMFYQLREIEDEEGTGLGLAIVERIVKHHGGKVWGDSEKGKGATFYFTLPKRYGP